MSVPLGDSVLGSWFENDAPGQTTWANVQRELQDLSRESSTELSMGTAAGHNGLDMHVSIYGSTPEAFSQTNLATNLSTFRAEPSSPGDLIDQHVQPGSQFSRAMTENGFGNIVQAINQDGVEMTTRITPEGTWARTYSVGGFNRTVAVYDDGRVVERLTQGREELMLSRNDQMTYINPRLAPLQRSQSAAIA